METIITDLELLQQPAEPLTFLTEAGAQTDEGNEIIAKIKEVMLANNDILALAAPQIGINKRIFCLRFNDVIKTFINPIITKKHGLTFTIETCASMPGKEIVIGRPEEITVVYYNDEFKYEDNKLLGAAASMFDQQAQLLDGVLPSELGLVSDIEQDCKVEEEDLDEIITFYKDTFLPARLASLNEAVMANEETEKAFKKLKLTENVINGRTMVLESEDTASKRAKAKKAANKAITRACMADRLAKKQDFTNYVKTISKKSHR